MNGSADALKLSGLRAIVTRQFTERAPEGRGAEDVHEGLNSEVALPGIGEAEVVGLLPDAQEIEAGLLAREPQADADVGPAVAHRLGDAPVVRRQPAGRLPAFEQFVEALPSPGAGLPADPAEVGVDGLLDRREPQAGRR